VKKFLLGLILAFSFVLGFVITKRAMAESAIQTLPTITIEGSPAR
jgi:hypothetical protein